MVKYHADFGIILIPYREFLQEYPYLRIFTSGLEGSMIVPVFATPSKGI